MSARPNCKWPVLTKYDQSHLRQIALPLGGIGTGTISLGGRGQLCAWEVGNNPSKTFIPRRTFFAIHARSAGRPPVTRVLEGVLEPPYEGHAGATAPNHGLPRFRKCSFHAAYPFGQVLLSDPDVPVAVTMQGFNPLVPADADASGIPVAVLRFVLTNTTRKAVKVSVCGSFANFIGALGGAPLKNVNEFRKAGGLQGIFMRSDGILPDAANAGTVALTTDAKDVTYRTSWLAGGWDVPVLDFWDDFSEDGRLEDRPATGEHDPMASLSASVSVAAGGTRSVTFFITWHFPNRQTWTPSAGESKTSGPAGTTTDFLRNWKVSAFQPLNGNFAQLALPGNMAGLGLADRVFKGDFCDCHQEIAARGPKDEVLYYATTFTCSEKMKLTAILGYDGPVKAWVDGREIFCDPTGTNPAGKEDGRAAFEAAAGAHELVVALGTNKGAAWGVFLRLKRDDVTKAQMKAGGNAYAMPELHGAGPRDCGCGSGCADPNTIGNCYAVGYADAWAVAARTAKDLPRLEPLTLSFVRSFCDSRLPAVVKEAALFNLSTLRSQTCFRTKEGHLGGWEGCGDTVGCCYGSCTHVWNYENATGFLYGDLAWTMREAEFKYATNDEGLMSFRINLPLERAQEFGKAAADGQMGAIMRLYREWQLSGDEAKLRELWPQARKALEFCWIKGGWDADRDGVMEGCQHNTMDVEYYGPNPQMGIWYLGALRACEEMARHLGETAFAATCRGLYEQGSQWLDKNLFNGEYYEHEVRPPADAADVAPSLRLDMGAKDLRDPDFQIGSGCLVDQLVGQYMAHALGLGYLTRPENVRKTLRSIRKYNFKENLFAHFNNMRSYALNDESALLMASYPRGRRPRKPFPYFNEVMTGFEYTAAVGMLYEGQVRDGLRCIKAVRDRYDGARRSPFNEAECGHHYARAMASWTAVLALTGFHYSAVAGALTLAAQDGAVFWSTGYGWGVCRQKKAARTIAVELEVLFGAISLKTFALRDWGAVELPARKSLKAGHVLKLKVPRAS